MSYPMHKRVLCLWAHPRSRSTAFERMMIERGDFFVLHEPFCTLFDTGELKITSWDGSSVKLDSYAKITNFILAASQAVNVFVKETCEYHYGELFGNPEFFQRSRHAMMIRDPGATINSHYAINPQITCEQIGYTHLAALKIYIEEVTRQRVPVIDSDDLMKNPEAVTEAYSREMAIDFKPHALTWTAEARPEWNRTVKWHAAASQSTQFSAIEANYKDTVDNHDVLKSYYKLHRPIYEALRACKLGAAKTAVLSEP
jgi:hypothetical protein